MAKSITVEIRNHEYRIIADEDAKYIQACAEMVNIALEEALKGTTLSLSDGAVLAAMNLADRCCKERQVTDNLRSQLKQALDDNARLSREMGRKDPGRRPKAEKGGEEE
ncbi:MAG: cell division protein ZapA [Ruminiclostridium sp.]|jgi:cell division protein ZapA (FtsZ GTPase activity inhibitor)|nr:cell division protein ZapA [Ruminiclostridium sp.]